MKEIGGYFELELSKGKSSYHTTPSFKSGRSALHLILKFLKPQKVYIPFYTCDALLQPFLETGFDYEFYKINEALEPVNLPNLNKGECFLYINYFDLKRETVDFLSEKYRDQLIVDCSQAFFIKGNSRSWYFNSCRKFFGIPDGAYMYSPFQSEEFIAEERNENYTVQHLIERFNGNTYTGYSFFLKNEVLCNSQVQQMSLLSEQLLSHVDYEMCKQKRIENFYVLHQNLKHKNKMKWVENKNSVPMVYPYYPINKIEHSTLWDQRIFVPILWRDVIERNGSDFVFEKKLSNNLLSLPIDHRYNADDMIAISKTLEVL